MVMLKILKTAHPSRELLLLADESQPSIDDYLGRSVCYAAMDDGQLLGQYLLLHTRPFTAEIVSIAVAEPHQRQGIGAALLRHAITTAHELGFRILEIGTGDSGIGQIALYKRCGFVQCGIDHDYFRRHYPAPIFEHGVECRHMVRLRIYLS